jgi:hypothetical protein
MFATLLPVGYWFPTAAMEQADRKSARPESLLGGDRGQIPFLQFE